VTELRVFVSKPSTVTERYRSGIERFNARIAELGFVAQTLGVSIVGRTNPLEDVVDLVDRTHGMIVLGWPQIEIRDGFLRDAPFANTCLATEWNHIEPAIARARGRPTIFLRERSVKARGLLDAASLGTYVREIDGLRPDWADDLSEILTPFRRDMEAFSRRNIAYESLCVLKVLYAASAPRALTAAELRKELGYPAGQVKSVLKALVDSGRVECIEYLDSSNEYKITSGGKAFFDGFTMGAAWRV